MERFQDPERLAALFARCRIPERLPWTAAYPWTLQYYEKGEYLCRLREPMESLYLLLEGGIQTSLTNAAGRTRLVATAQPGELVGGDVEVVLGNVQATTDQRAQEDGALCAALPLAEYREALCSDLGFLRYASRRLARIVVMNTFRATNDLLLPLEKPSGRLSALPGGGRLVPWHPDPHRRDAEHQLPAAYPGDEPLCPGRIPPPYPRGLASGRARRAAGPGRKRGALPHSLKKAPPFRWNGGALFFPGVGHMAYLPVENIC